MGIDNTHIPYTNVDYLDLANTTLNDQIHIIQNSMDFSSYCIDIMTQNPNWCVLQYHFAERTGYLGDIYLLDTVKSMYIQTIDSDIIDSLLIGGSKGGHVHIMKHAMQYEDVKINLNRDDIICNVFQSSIDEAIEYILEFSTNYSFILFMIKKTRQIDFYNDKKLIANILRFGNETDRNELIKNITDINSLLYGLGASDDVVRINDTIFSNESDITIPLKAACIYGSMNVIKYYYETIGIGHTISSHELVGIVLKHEQFIALEYMIMQGLDLLPILNFQVSGFDYEKLMPILNNYLTKCDYPQ